MPPVDVPLRVREPPGLSQNPVGELRRAPRHPASPYREPEGPGPSAPELPVTASHLPALAPPQDSLRWHRDVFVTVDQITPRKVCPACYADPGGLDDALGQRASVRDSQATRGEILPVVRQTDSECLGQAARAVAKVTRAAPAPLHQILAVGGA